MFGLSSYNKKITELHNTKMKAEMFQLYYVNAEQFTLRITQKEEKYILSPRWLFHLQSNS